MTVAASTSPAWSFHSPWSSINDKSISQLYRSILPWQIKLSSSRCGLTAPSLLRLAVNQTHLQRYMMVPIFGTLNSRPPVSTALRLLSTASMGRPPMPLLSLSMSHNPPIYLSQLVHSAISKVSQNVPNGRDIYTPSPRSSLRRRCALGLLSRHMSPILLDLARGLTHVITILSTTPADDVLIRLHNQHYIHAHDSIRA